MRKLASFDDPAFAEALREVLYAADVPSEVRPGPDDTNVVWIVAETDLDRARSLLDEYVADPDNGRYDAAREAARIKREAAKKAQKSSRHKVVDVRKTFRDRAAESPVTMTILGACMAVALATQLGGGRSGLLQYLTIVGFNRAGLRDGLYTDLLDGELWRLFTPILIHFGAMHLIFNAFWLIQLGGPTERYQGSWRYLGLILWSAGISNLAQLYFAQNPSFGGLSGVIYALVGYLWARGKADPNSGIGIPPPASLGFFMIWLALGFSGTLDGLIGPMANWCHLGGFAAGVVYGYIAALIATGRLRR
jgi:GlpG protein